MLPLIALAIGVAGIVLVANYWDDIVNWLEDIIPKVKDIFARHYRDIANATAIFVQKIKNSIIRIIHRLFFKRDNKWYRESRPQEVDESEVPDWVKKSIADQEVDKTKQFRDELQLEL